MALALMYPAYVEALILIDNAPVHMPVDSDLVNYIEKMKMIERSCIKQRKDADHLLQSSINDIRVRQFLLSNLIHDENQLRFRIPLDTLEQSLQDLAGFPFQGSYSGRTLLIRGSKSRYVLDSYLPTIRNFFPNVEILTFNAGHWGFNICK